MSIHHAFADAANDLRVSVMLCHIALTELSQGKSIKMRYQAPLFQACLNVVETIAELDKSGRLNTSLHPMLKCIEMIDGIVGRLPTAAERAQASALLSTSWAAYRGAWAPRAPAGLASVPAAT